MFLLEGRRAEAGFDLIKPINWDIKRLSDSCPPPTNGAGSAHKKSRKRGIENPGTRELKIMEIVEENLGLGKIEKAGTSRI